MKHYIKKYVTTRPLWVNILIAFILVLIIAFLFMLSLNWITNHGVSQTVPLVTGKTYEEVQDLLGEKDFEVVIQDSVFYDSLPPYMVIKQLPEAGAVVKVNRTVYVTVNRALPPEFDMPNLIGPSFRHAEMILKNLGLRLGDTTYRPDFAKNSVLEQLYNGQPIAPGTKIRQGSSISLVLGSGVSNEVMTVPRLLGLSLSEAKVLLDAHGLVLGSVLPDPDVRDNENAFVYRQSPPTKNEDGKPFHIRPGQLIDVWLSVQRPNVDSLERANRLPPPEEEEDL